MDPSEDNAGKVMPERNTYSQVTLFALLIIALQILISLATYPFLPGIVPTHWNVAGQVDAYAPKWVNAVLFPAVSLGMYVLVRLIVAVGPRLGSQGRSANRDIVNLILVGLLLFMLVLQLTTTAIALGLPVDMSFVMNLSLSVLLIFVGNYMGKLRRNFWAGIRTPWTIVSEVSWERTHRLGGWLFVVGGLLGIILSFVPPLRYWGIMTILALIVVILVVSTVTQIGGQSGQLRFSRPKSVRPVSVPSSFQQVIDSGVASQTNQAGTSPLKPGTAPPL